MLYHKFRTFLLTELKDSNEAQRDCEIFFARYGLEGQSPKNFAQVGLMFSLPRNRIFDTCDRVLHQAVSVVATSSKYSDFRSECHRTLTEIYKLLPTPVDTVFKSIPELSESEILFLIRVSPLLGLSPILYIGDCRILQINTTIKIPKVQIIQLLRKKNYSGAISLNSFYEDLKRMVHNDKTDFATAINRDLCKAILDEKCSVLLESDSDIWYACGNYVNKILWAARKRIAIFGKCKFTFLTQYGVPSEVVIQLLLKNNFSLESNGYVKTQTVTAKDSFSPTTLKILKIFKALSQSEVQISMKLLKQELIKHGINTHTGKFIILNSGIFHKPQGFWEINN